MSLSETETYSSSNISSSVASTSSVTISSSRISSSVSPLGGGGAGTPLPPPEAAVVSEESSATVPDGISSPSVTPRPSLDIARSFSTLTSSVVLEMDSRCFISLNFFFHSGTFSPSEVSPFTALLSALLLGEGLDLDCMALSFLFHSGMLASSSSLLFSPDCFESGEL